MISGIKKPENQQRYAKAFEWVKLISVTGSVQVLVQALSFVSGILIIRLLKPEEYALYTLANAMLGTMVVLADGGISTGVMAMGAKVHEDREKLGAVLATGFDLRKKFAIGSFVIAIPILLYLLRTNNASWTASVLVVLALIPAFFTALSGNLLENIAKIKQDIFPLQRIRMFNNIGRLGLLSITIFIFPFAYVALLANALPNFWANWKMRKNAKKYTDLSQKPDPEVRKGILAMVKRILPGAAYYSISGQITVFLIATFGRSGPTAVAEVGGLDRLSMIITIFTTLFVTLVTPRFARLHNEKALLFNRAVQIHILLFGTGFCIVGGVWLFSDYALMLIGSQYANLQYELVINIFAACLGMVAGGTYSLFTSRGWNLHPAFSIPLNILTISAGVALFDVGTVQGVLYLNVLVSSVNFVTNSTYLFYKIRFSKY